jgi:CRP-like cAMP-binding protein
MIDTTILRSAPAFRSLNESEATVLFRNAEVRTFEADEQILCAGEPGDTMFVIADGSVVIPLREEDGRVRMTVKLKAGDFFGEMALLTGEPRSADVFTHSDGPCTCVVLDKSMVDSLLKQHPPVARFLTEILGQRLLEGGAMRQVGKYRLVNELGRGGMAIVYQGFHDILKRTVAVKMLPHNMIYEADFLGRFTDEARIIAELRHEHIVQVYDIEEAFNTLFIVMEYLDGQDLQQVLSENGPMDFTTARTILRDVASALQYAHDRGIIHRDIKPSNIFLQKGGRSKIVDFGIAARSAHKSGDIFEGDMVDFCGTPEYAAPESVLGNPVDGRTDIYSLGLVAYNMLTGERAFTGNDTTEILRRQLNQSMPQIREHLPELPEDLAEFIERATAKRPEDRFPDCNAILQHLSATTADLDLDTLRTAVVTVLYDDRAAEDVQFALDEVRNYLRNMGARFVATGTLDRNE